MKKLLIRSISIVTIMSLLTACGIEEHPKEVEFPDNISVTPEPEPEVPEEFSEVTVTSLKALANFPIGVAVPRSLLTDTAHQDVVIRHFSQLSSENDMKMDAMHPSESTFDFTKADALLSFAEANGLSVHGHVLVWHSQIPDWIKNFEGNESSWVAMMENHVTQIATRYSGQLETWDVVNEAIDTSEPDNIRNSFWKQTIGPDYVVKAFESAKKHIGDKDIKLFYNDYSFHQAAKRAAIYDLVVELNELGLIGVIDEELDDDQTEPAQDNTEQLEEEAQARTMLDKLNIIGDDKTGHYMFDRDIMTFAQASEEQV